MLVDLHVYTNISGGLALPRAIEAARSAGLDAICIADRQASREAAQAVLDGAVGDFPVFLAVEVPTRVGDVLLVLPGVDPFYSREEWRQLEALQRPGLKDVQDLASREGGVVLIAHPYDRSRKVVLRDRIFAVNDVSGIELATGGADERSNALALEAVSHAAVPAFAGSASRKNAARGGQWATLFAEAFTTQEGLVAALRGGNFWPVEILPEGGAPPRGGSSRGHGRDDAGRGDGGRGDGGRGDGGRGDGRRGRGDRRRR